jgi:hypothetical protein
MEGIFGVRLIILIRLLVYMASCIKEAFSVQIMNRSEGSVVLAQSEPKLQVNSTDWRLPSIQIPASIPYLAGDTVIPVSLR